MVPRLVGLGGLIALAALAGLAGGCASDNILSGPTPAGVTVAPLPTMVTGPGTAPSAAPTTTTPSSGPSGATVVTGLELKVRQLAGGCWESFAPGGPSSVVRQDLWFTTTATCQGNGWSVALQVFAGNAMLKSAAQVPTTAAALLRDGTVLVVVAPSAAVSVRSLLASQSGVQAVPHS
jgi:hypothetical protein